ncbi:MAG: sigma-70 family RNA polymerase sigma factor [Pseudomonadota bacterium]
MAQRTGFAGTQATVSDDERAIKRLYSANVGRIAGALRKSFGDGPPDPDDISHFAFQKLLEHRKSNDVRNPEAFLWRTARNLVLNEKKRDTVRARYDFEVEQLFFAHGGDIFDPERLVSAKQQIKLMRQVIADMPYKRQTAFVLHRVDGLSISDVARRMALSRTAVTKHLARAFADIDAALQALSGDEANA